MTSFVEVLKRLTPGTYSTREGSIRELRDRLPEFRERTDREVRREVEGAVKWAVRHICVPWALLVRSRTGSTEAVSMYGCLHPGTGRFYLVTREMHGSGPDGRVQDFVLTESVEEAIAHAMGLAAETGERSSLKTGE